MSTRSTACKIVITALAAAFLLLTAAGPAFAGTDAVIAEIPQGLSVDNALWAECPLGDYTADAVRLGSGAQIALIPSGLLASALIGDGQVTEAEVTDLLRTDEAVRVCALTAPQLKALLEDSVSHWQLTERETLDGEASAYEGFLQISGFTMKADATAEVGDRVVSVTLDGEPLDLADETVTFTAAMPGSLAPDLPGEQAEASMLDMIREHIVSQGTVEVPSAERIHVIGAHARDLITIFPPWIFLLILVVLVGNHILTRTRKDQAESKPF